MHYNPFTLSFIKEWAFLEPRFRQFYFQENLNRMRLSLYLAIFMYAVFDVLDAVIAPEQKIIFWIIRYAIVIPVTLVVAIWSFHPGYKGIEVAEKIRNRIPGIPVILCTGYNQDITPGRMKQAGICAFLMKPVPKTRLTKDGPGQVLDGASNV